MTPFDFQSRTRMVFGPDTIDRLGAIAAEYGWRRAMVVSDPGIVSAGHVQRGIDSLSKAGLETTLFDGARENPTTTHVASGVAYAKAYAPDLLIGLGGGSSMDCAKGINFIYSCGGSMQDYWGVGKATADMLPMIAVPTTSGTGSEMQSFALISDAETHVKMACGDQRAAFRVAILDPKLTLTQPAQVTALTGIDALSHALETYVTNKRNALSLSFSRESWKLLAESFPKVLRDPADLESRSEMQLGASFAGLAIEYSMLGASHALANPLTATYGIAHGQAVGMVLPHVIRFNGEQFPHWYDDLNFLYDHERDGVKNSVEQVAEFVASVLKLAGLEQKLSACGVQRERLPELAVSATKQWTGTFNPRKVAESDFLEMYKRAF
jgi:alcohol dehydrogenase